MKRFLFRVIWITITPPLTALSGVLIGILWRLEVEPEWSRDYDPTSQIVFSLIFAIVFCLTFVSWVKAFGNSPVAILERFDRWLHQNQG
jgi:hypothetical protein